MELYNSLINEVSALLPQTASGSWTYEENRCWTDKGISELVMQRDAAYELGAAGKGSANLVLFTSSPALVPENKVVLYGKDLTELKGDCDFARIVLLRVGVMDDEDETIYRTLKDIEFSKYHVYPEGYMIRMSPESCREQVRVSRDAIRRGVSFRTIGNRYIREYLKNDNVLSAQVIFLTDPSMDYGKLKDYAKKGNDLTGTLTHILEGLPTDCSVCALKDICDEVEGMKELHFGVGAKGTK